MSDYSFSDDDMEAGDVGEGACVRVVQSSLHTSIMQTSLFKVIEKYQENEEGKHEQTPVMNLTEDLPLITPHIEEKPDSQSSSREINFSDIETPALTQEQQFLEESPILSESTPEIITGPNGEKVKIIKNSHMHEILRDKPKKKPKKNKKLNAKKRFSENKSKANKKIDSLKEEKESEIVTFQPKTSLDPKEERNFSHFLTSMTISNETSQRTLEKLQSEKFQEEFLQKPKLFKPTLSKNTQKIASKHKSSVNLHLKLYNEYEELKKKKEAESQAVLKEQCTFKPVLDKRSADLKREGLATDRLYKEALNKQSKIFPFEERKSEKLISEYSEAIVREKFLKEVTKHLLSFQETLNFEEFLFLLQNTRFVHDNESKKYPDDKETAKKAWDSLVGTEAKATQDKIKEFLLGVMNLVKPDGPLKCVFVEFRRFYENRRDHVEKPSKTKNFENFAFKPEINPFSLELAKTVKFKRLTDYSTDKPEKVFQLLQEETKKKLNLEREKISDIGMKDCTFKPKTVRGPLVSEESWAESESLTSDYFKILNEKPGHRCEVLFGFAKVEQERREKGMRSLDDMDIERNMAECTFSPNLEKRVVRVKTVKEVRKVKKVIEKLKWKQKELRLFRENERMMGEDCSSCLEERRSGLGEVRDVGNGGQR